MENKKISSTILKEKDDILNLLNTLENKTHKDIRKEKVRIEKLQSLYSVEYIDTYLREVNKMPKWLVPADDKELKRKTNRQSHEFSQIDESFKSDKTFLSADRIRNLKMMVLNAELLDSSKIDVNKIKQAGLNLERFCDKMDFNTKVICEDLDEEVKDFASKCSCSSKVLKEVNCILDSEIQVQKVADNMIML